MKNLYVIFLVIFSTSMGFAQVGINTANPSPASVLHISSSTNGTTNFGGLLPPTVDLSQRATISPTAADDGLLIFLKNGTTRCIQIWDGTQLQWENIYCIPNNSAPVATNVTFTGILQEGQILDAGFTYTDVNGDPAGAHSYTWYRANTAAGAGAVAVQSSISSSYTLVAADIGQFIAVEVTPVAASGTSPGTPVISTYQGPVISAPVFASDLFISEYVEGSSNNKVLEFANFTGSPINLANYTVRGYQNGNIAVGYTYTFPSITLANGAVYVVGHSTYIGTVNESFNWLFNGNDVVELYKTTTNARVDIIGTIGSSTNFALDTTLRKKPGIGPSIVYLVGDYNIFPLDTFNGLGSHTF